MRPPLFVAALATACSSRGEKPPPPPRTSLDAAPPTIAPPDTAVPWFDRFDFDGDGRNDHVKAEYTGGGHCCYRFSVQLTTGGEVSLPFQMDGGYVGGDLLSNPRRFAIRISDAGVAEMWMEIETYNGEPQPLDPAWTRRWGFSSHRVVIQLRGGKVTVRDQ